MLAAIVGNLQILTRFSDGRTRLKDAPSHPDDTIASNRNRIQAEIMINPPEQVMIDPDVAGKTLLEMVFCCRCSIEPCLWIGTPLMRSATELCISTYFAG